MAIKKKRILIKEGDVFTIPIDDETQGCGQIIKIPSEYDFIMVVFEGRWSVDKKIQPEEIIKQQVLFLGYTTDTLLNIGRWIIIGNVKSNLKSITMPYYKLAFPPETKLINYKLDFIRMALPEEDKLLNFQHSMSPMGYQKELQSYYGIIEWESDIKYNYKHMVSVLAKLNLLPN